MLRSFSQKTIRELKYYVYVYSDPDTHRPFYVGKGKGNRVFDHLTLEDESEKAAYIRMLRENGKEPLIEILVHGVDEETALKVEAAAIDLVGIENLTNRQRGHNSSEYGKIEVSVLEHRYNCRELRIEDFQENVMLIRINKQYVNGMTAHQLYEAARGYWKVNLDQARRVKYALAVFDGMVLEVYEIAEWFPAFSTMMCQRQDQLETYQGRYEFVGRIAPEKIRKKYKDQSVAQIFSKGDQNPIRYIVCSNKSPLSV